MAFIGNTAFGADAGVLRYLVTATGRTLPGDINGHGNADFNIDLLGVRGSEIRTPFSFPMAPRTRHLTPFDAVFGVGYDLLSVDGAAETPLPWGPPTGEP